MGKVARRETIQTAEDMTRLVRQTKRLEEVVLKP